MFSFNNFWWIEHAWSFHHNIFHIEVIINYPTTIKNMIFSSNHTGWLMIRHKQKTGRIYCRVFLFYIKRRKLSNIPCVSNVGIYLLTICKFSKPFIEWIVHTLAITRLLWNKAKSIQTPYMIAHFKALDLVVSKMTTTTPTK